MGNKILMYLFIFTLLFTIFIYVNDKKILDAKEEKIETLQNMLTEMEADAEATANLVENESYFSLKDNEDAISYFENKGVETKGLITRIEDAIISRNKAGEDNSLVPMDGMEGNMRINKVSVLNHKWIIADFTDGTYWGELFLSYEVARDGTIQFVTEKSFLYSAN